MHFELRFTSLQSRGFVCLLFQVRCLPAIAFLQPDDIEAGFNAVTELLPDECLELAFYFEGTYMGRDIAGRWVAPQFDRAEWSQYARTLAGLSRTTNSIEGWHRRFAGRVGCDHPSVFPFIRCIQIEEDHWRGETEKAIAGLPGVRRRLQWQVLSDRVRRLVERRRDGGADDIKDYVRGIAHHFTF